MPTTDGDRLPTHGFGVQSLPGLPPPLARDFGFQASKSSTSRSGFQHRLLTDRLAEMTLGTCSFLLPKLYVREWAGNLIIHLFVSDLNSWWDHIIALDLSTRYGVKTSLPQLESWGIRVAGLIDPSGVLWTVHEVP